MLRPVVARIVRVLTARQRRQRLALQHGRAFAAWFEAVGRIEAAKSRGDTRGQHIAEQDARRAMTLRLAIEAGR